jgi:hypothetical protein
MVGLSVSKMLYVFFWVFPRRLIADSRRFGTLYQFHFLRQFDAVCSIELPKKMKPIEGSETSAIGNQTPGKHPKENILHVKHGENLKSRKKKLCARFVPHSLTPEQSKDRVTSCQNIIAMADVNKNVINKTIPT